MNIAFCERRSGLLLVFGFWCLVFSFPCSAVADFVLAKKGKARCVVVHDPDATVPEIKAAEELADILGRISGATFEIQKATGKIPRQAIIVGQGKSAEQFFPNIPFSELGPDEIVMCVQGGKLLLAGGRPRGTLYSVYRFLQEQCGVRWWMPWATDIPQKSTLKVPALNVRYTPPFEYRAPFTRRSRRP